VVRPASYSELSLIPEIHMGTASRMQAILVTEASVVMSPSVKGEGEYDSPHGEFSRNVAFPDRE
jgi:hypothetical protein